MEQTNQIQNKETSPTRLGTCQITRELNAHLQVAKNYLEQEIEVSGLKPNVVFGPHKGVTVYHNATSIVAIADKRMLMIFHENVNIETLEVPTKVDYVQLADIKSVAALYCKRCRIYLEKHEGLIRCKCGKYLKPRKRFFIQGENRVENSDELAEIQFAIKDARDARKIKSKRKSALLGPLSYEDGGMSCSKFMDRPRSTSRLIDRIASIKIDGKKVPEECVAAIALGLSGPIEEECNVLVQAELALLQQQIQ